MNLFHHPLWLRIRPYAHVTAVRGNLDFLGLPDDLRTEALALELPCVSCGVPIHPLRARAKSERSRIAGTPVEHRLFYAATCPQEINQGCTRTKVAKLHKQHVATLIELSHVPVTPSLVPPAPMVSSWDSTEHHLKDGILLQADATSPATVARVRGLFGEYPMGLIVADPWYGEVIPEIGDTCKAVTGLEATQDGAEDAFVDWMLAWTRLWTEPLAEGGAFYVWGGVGKPKFRPFYQYAHRVEWETGLTIAMPITWKKKRAYGVQHNYLFTREECLYLIKGDQKKPRVFHVPLTDEKRGYAGYNAKYPAKSAFLRRSNVWTEDGALTPNDDPAAIEYRMAEVWDETEILRGKTHDCEKAPRVSEIPIEVHTEPGEGVVDLFAGSAALSRAARRLGRAFVAVEHNEGYCRQIIEEMRRS